MQKIYVVMGSCGEYSERREWPVKAFINEREAERLIIQATLEANRIFSITKGSYGVLDHVNAHDPNMQMDYTGASYFFYETMLDEGLFINEAREAVE